MRHSILGLGTLTGTLTTYYQPLTGTIARVTFVRCAAGSSGGNLILKLEDNAGSPISKFLLNTYAISANTSIELRDLIVPAQYKLRASFSASNASLIIGGVENTIASNPVPKVLGWATLSGSPASIYTCASGKQARITHAIVASSSSGTVTLSIQRSGTDYYLRNGEAIGANSVLDMDFDIALHAGDILRASGSGDITLFGLEETL